MTRLPASPRPACVPASCLCPWVLPAPACSCPGTGSTHRWPGAPQGLPSLTPFSACHLCEQQDPHPAGGERMSGKGAITLHPSSVGQPWRGAGKGPAETQTTRLPFPDPKGCLCRAHGPTAALSLEPCKALAGGGSAGLPARGFPLGALPKSPPLALRRGRASGLRSGCAFRSAGTDNKSVPGRGAEGQSPT